MRSKIGTKSRLAANILALILLILILINAPQVERHSERPERSPRRTPERTVEKPSPIVPTVVSDTSGTLDRVHTPVGTTETPAEGLRPPVVAALSEDISAPVQDDLSYGEDVTPVDSLGVDSEPIAAPSVDETAEDVDGEPEPKTEPAETEDAAVESSGLSPLSEDQELALQPAESASDAGDVELSPEVTPEEAVAEETTTLAQPDESGAIVVAESAETTPIEPIVNANLEVLGDRVYWLGPGHDAERELATVPDLDRLIVLAPIPGYRIHGFEHVATEIIPADPADLGKEAAEHFLHLTSTASGPVVVVVRPGAIGAAFFKGAYLLFNRKLSKEDMLREIGPELEMAGAAGDDIVHRLKRLKD